MRGIPVHKTSVAKSSRELYQCIQIRCGIHTNPRHLPCIQNNASDLVPAYDFRTAGNDTADPSMEVLSSMSIKDMVKPDPEKFFLQALCRISSRVRGAAGESTVSMQAEGKDDGEIEQIHPFMLYLKIPGN